MARKPSLNHQMHQRMESMKCIGESKHQAKQEYRKICEDKGVKYNPAKTIGIHSFNTYENYKQVSKQFVAYLKENHKEVKDINTITRTHVEQYLKVRNDTSLSAYTISKDLSGLNKLFNLNISKRELGLRERTFKAVTRSREEKLHDKKYNPDNYKDQITFAKATGCRRESVLEVKPNDFKFNVKGEPVSVYLKEKGGRERDATILKEYRYDIKNIIACKPLDSPLFDKYTTKIDNHAFRGEYAQNRYDELVEAKGEDKGDYRGYDKESISQVSQDLGHNRLSVVVEHYLK